MNTHLVAPDSRTGLLVSLYSPSKGSWSWESETLVAEGGSTATDIITGLVVDMLTRSKVRN